MESVNEIKEALSAKSRTATLDELRSEGRKKVRLIRAEHIAAMVSEAVHLAIQESGLIDPGEHELLVEKSRAEFRKIIKEREQETQHAREVADRIEQREREFSSLQQRCEELTTSQAAARSELEQTNVGSAGLNEELDRAQTLVRELEGELSKHQAEAEQARAEAEQAAAAAPTAAAPAASNELLMSLFQEMATLKANMQAQQAQPAQPAAGADLSSALDKLTSSLNDRLEHFGKKMGISSAVEGDAPTDFSGLFKGAEKDLESNMDDVTLKQKSGGGIAANLARLKKLKGGG